MKSAPSKMRVLGILLVGGLLVYTSVKFFTGKGTIIEQSSVKVKPPPRMESVPGSVKDNARYKDLQEKDNVRRAETAKKKGVSALPTLVNRLKEEKSDEEFFEEATATPEPAAPERNTREDALRRAQEEADKRLRAQQDRLDRLRQEQDNRRQAAANARQNDRDSKERQKILQDQANVILGDMNQLIDPFRNPPRQNYVAGNPAALAQLPQTAGAAQEATATPLYKAGAIIYGVIVSNYSSDDAGIVRAKIVSGPLAGSTLIGNAQVPQSRFTDNMPITFNTLSRPNAPRSQAIALTAINARTETPGVASQVNRHYGQRYGAMVLSQVIDQISQQIQNNSGNGANAIQAGAEDDDAEQPQDNLDIDVTTPIAQDITGSLNEIAGRPATYTIAQGTPIGLMFENDFVLES